uniref:Ubinuclein n=1 Tax=Knipowitschia caucasica TaxID=637954 RepID=A0AAV2LEM3_KNICA
MTAPCRVQLTPLSDCPPGLLSPHTPAPAPVLPSDLKSGTRRFDLPLFEPDDRLCPEFSYAQLMDAQDCWRNVEEEKPRHQDRPEDLIDMGDGYDEDDSFIDNSEAYDEFVPADITTTLGGFYVNSGLLHFIWGTEEEGYLEPQPGEGPPAENTKDVSKRQKRKVEKLLKQRTEDYSVPCAKSSLVPDVCEKVKKVKKPILSMASAVRRCEQERDRQCAQALASARGLHATMGPADAGGGGCPTFTEPFLTLAPELDIVLLNEDGTSSETPVSLHKAEGPGTHTEAFPPELQDSIHSLMMASKTSEGESKGKFYTPEINQLLLQIDAQCRQHGGSLRTRVYSHLCSFLPCNKDTLLRRVGRLRQSRTEETSVEQLMKTLESAIHKSMPEQILRWKELHKAHEECRQRTQPTEEEVEGENKAPGPKKHFRWNQETRECVRRLLRLRLEQLQSHTRDQDQSKTTDQELHLRTVLDEELKPLWPKGWMSSRALLKESHKLLTPPLMPVKALPDPASLQPPSELLAAALARFQQGGNHRWRPSQLVGSPPLPPPPQCSPANLPLSPE